MIMDDPYQRPAFVPSVFYKDPRAALDWLAKAFGFRRTMVIKDPQGHIAHAEMRLGDGLVYVGGEWSDFAVSAATMDGRNTQTVHVHLETGVDAHCEQARLAGASILMEPCDQFYGDRSYRVRDLEGHVWTFSQGVRRVSRVEAEQASGLLIEAPDWP
jgi:uncharacterized glyoxalase superfamily protein PhnB